MYSIKKVATLHDAAVDTEVLNSKKIGKDIPKTTDSSYTTAALKSLVEAKHLGKRAKGLGFKIAMLSVTAVVAYMEVQKTNNLAIKYKPIEDRKCEISPKIKTKIKLETNNSSTAQKIARQESLTEAVKRNKLSAKNLNSDIK